MSWRSQPLIDAHVHLYPNREAGARAKAGYQIWEYGDDPGVRFDPARGVLDEVGDRYQTEGFDHAVVLQLFDVAAERARVMASLAPGGSGRDRAAAHADVDALLVEGVLEANRWVVAAAGAHPLLTAYVGIDPCLLPEPLLTSHLCEMAALGARGVKLHPVSQGFEPDDARLAPLYDLCCELDLVVLSHSGPGHRHGATARPGEFAPVLARWPRLRLVLAHLGGAAFSEAGALAADFPSVTFDLSEIIEWIGAPNAPSLATFVEVVRTNGPERVMLGSDFPWYDPSATADKVWSLPGLGEAERAALLGGSAIEILQLERAGA